MTSYQHVSLADFRQALTTEAVQISRIIHASLAGGTLFFTGAAFFLYSTYEGPPPDSADVSSSNLMSIIHAGFALFSIAAGRVLFGRIMTGKGAGQGLPGTAAAWILRIRTAWLVRLALFEGAAFLGLAATVLTATNGVAQEEPGYLLNMATAGFFVMFIILTFPDAERMEQVFQEFSGGASGG